MRKAMRRFLDWLDSRFPAKVVVTERDFCEMAARLTTEEQFNMKLRHILDNQAAQIGKLEESIRAIKEAMNKTPAQQAQDRRAEYVSTGRLPT